MLKIVYSLVALVLPLLAFADHCAGKVDIGPVYAHVNVLDSGKTIKQLDMAGFKASGTIMIKEGYGFCVKPDFLYATGHGELISGALGFGHVTPVTDYLCLTPSVGVTLTNLRTSASFPTGFPAPYPQKIRLRERFRSLAPYIGLDVSYTIVKGLRICANAQYSWSHTHTRLPKDPTGKKTYKDNSTGPTISAMLEKDISEEWSVHVGAAYNLSLNNEKHGLRGYGFKLGVARWF